VAGRYVFDIETNGLLKELDKVHCIGIKCLDTGKTWPLVNSKRRAGDMAMGLKLLADADLIVGHNIIGFDLPALQKVYPGWKTKAVVRDTLVLTRLMWPHIKDSDFAKAEAGKLPKKLIGAHALEAWGYRLGNYKGDFKGPWDTCTPEMVEYMMQDVSVTATLWQRIEKEAALWEVPLEDPNPPPRKDCIELEHRVAEIVEWVQRHGFAFDEKKATALHAKIAGRKQELVVELEKAFPPKVIRSTFTPKVNNKKLGYKKGEPFEKVTTVHFNPGSRQQVAERLQGLGWKPQAFGKDGVATVDDDILKALPYPQAKLLAEFYTLDKRVGQIANGKEAWLKRVKHGRIHGRIHSGGAHTGRMTHSTPNLAQVPGNHAPYGKECRECFTADEGYVLVGCDADALELRDLAGYMARFDGGAYIETVLRGDKAKGTDMHTINANAIGCSRDAAKVFFYAMIYGSGDWNLGVILGVKGSRTKVAAAGKNAKARLMKAVPALGKLVEAVAKAVKRGYIVGLDGRRLKARAENAAINTLLQSAGAVQMKRGLVNLVDALASKGWQFGREYALVGLIHDEWQANVKPELADEYGNAAAQAIRDAGTYYAFACPLEAQYQKGATWKETH
jgi:hypothetical protein